MNLFSPFLHASTSTYTEKMAKFLGSYILTKSENFEKYMESVGVGFVMKKLASSATPTTEISQNGDDWTIKTFTTFKTTTINFKLGQEFEEETADGRKVHATITLEGDDTLVHKQRFFDTKRKQEVVLAITRQFNDQEMKMTLEGLDNQTAYRYYKKL